MGPGAHDTNDLGKFGGDTKRSNIGMGSKYVFKPDRNPGAGEYDLDSAMKHVKPRAYEATILGDEKKTPFPSQTRSNAGPDCGAYH